MAYPPEGWDSAVWSCCNTCNNVISFCPEGLVPKSVESCLICWTDGWNSSSHVLSLYVFICVLNTLKVSLTVKPGDQKELRTKQLPKGAKRGRKKKTPEEIEKSKPDKKNKTTRKRKTSEDQDKPKETRSRRRESKEDRKKTAATSKVAAKSKAMKAEVEKPKAKSRARKVAPAPTPDAEGTEEKVYGCSRCRNAAKGCKTCKNPDFKPRGPRKSKPAKEASDAD